jgi:hypothetical protein
LLCLLAGWGFLDILRSPCEEGSHTLLIAKSLLYSKHGEKSSLSLSKKLLEIFNWQFMGLKAAFAKVALFSLIQFKVFL